MVEPLKTDVEAERNKGHLHQGFTGDGNVHLEMLLEFARIFKWLALW